MQDINYKKTMPSAHDIKWARYVKQWFHQGSALVIPATEAKIRNRIDYLIKAVGTGLTLKINDRDGNQLTVISGVDVIDFVANPLCLGEFGYEITGTVNSIVGFYV